MLGRIGQRARLVPVSATVWRIDPGEHWLSRVPALAEIPSPGRGKPGAGRPRSSLKARLRALRGEKCARLRPHRHGRHAAPGLLAVLLSVVCSRSRLCPGLTLSSPAPSRGCAVRNAADPSLRGLGGTSGEILAKARREHAEQRVIPLSPSRLRSRHRVPGGLSGLSCPWGDREAPASQRNRAGLPGAGSEGDRGLAGCR
jgi:hypothetical protein